MTQRIAQASITIWAPIERVWSVIIELSRYRDWNPFIYDVVNAPEELSVGSRFLLRVRWADGTTAESWETTTHLAPPTHTSQAPTSAMLAYRYSSWLARVGLVRATREQHLLQKVGEAATHYSTRETFHGPLARFLPLANVEEGFQRHARALKQHAESGGS